MQVIIDGRGVTLTPTLKTLVTRKLGKLTRLLPRIIDAHVTCGRERFRRTVRLRLRARRRVFSSVGAADELTVAIDEAVETLSRQVREDKARRRRVRRRPLRATPGSTAQGESDVVEPVA
jgi:putative sigma-54 modulation protein